MVSLFFFLLYISVININLCHPPPTTTFSKKTSGTFGTFGTIGNKSRFMVVKVVKVVNAVAHVHI